MIEKRINYVQLSGPMTGFHDFNRRAFNEIDERLRKYNIKVFNPARIQPHNICEEQEHWMFSLVRCLESMTYNRKDKRAILAQLPGWEQSPGAQIEHIAAKRLGYEIIAIEDLWGELL